MSNYPPEKAEFHTPFGGFWTDLRNSREILAGKHTLEWISDKEFADLSFWIENGYVILKDAIPHALIDAVQRDIDKVIDTQYEPSRICYWKKGEKFSHVAQRQHMKEAEAKLLDMHMLSEAVREAIFAPVLLRFLNLVFERHPNAFQSLAFEYGSQQPIHCDVAFVKVSSPREFVASWIALEDISEGSGELEYYPGSQRLPDHQFGDHTPWAEGDLAKYSNTLIKKAGDAGAKVERFLPKKGDVLFWNAGLYHGGSPRTKQSLTRKSLVTHYCPSDRYPMYADGSFNHCRDTPYGGTVSGCFPSSVQSV